MIKSLLILSVLLLIFVNSVSILAQDVTSDSLAHERIQYIQQALNQSRKNVNVWWYGWLGIYGVATVGQGAAFLLSHDLNTRQDMALGTGTALVGLVGQVLMPLNTGHDADIIAQLPETTKAEQLSKLAKAEELFKLNATNEKIGRSWQIHALNEAVNLGSGLITWIGYKRSVWEGVGTFLLNSVVTETQIWTQPNRTQKDYENYCKKYKADNNHQAYEPPTEYYLSTYPGGVSLRIVF
ncbi:MAG: hypothetical protein PHR83_18720 [Paludibacter sp.]|nr:hypothetical protein [Paludibacter sp.]